MDLGWLAASVAAVSGAVVTIWVHHATTRSSERLAQSVAKREDTRRTDDLLRERRVLERNAVLGLVAEFRAAHRYQQRFVFTAFPVRMDVPGHGSVTEVVETDKLEEAFPLWWETRHDGLSVDVELITDVQFRESARVCLAVLDDVREIARLAGGEPVGALVARASYTGFMVLGAWLREEPISEEFRKQVADLRDVALVL